MSLNKIATDIADDCGSPYPETHIPMIESKVEKYAKEKSIKFNKWLFSNKLAPNSSFLWFRYDYKREDVRFYEIEHLYSAFILGMPFSQFEKISALRNEMSFEYLKSLIK